MIYFFLLHLVIFIYLLIRAVLPLDFSRKIKFALAVLIFVTSQHYLVRFAFDSLSTPEIPGILIAIEGWCFATTLFLFLLVLLRDCYFLSQRFSKSANQKRRERRIFGNKNPRKLSEGRRKAILALTVIAAAPAAYGVKQGVSLPKVKEWSEPLHDLPKELEGLVITQLSDLHVSSLFGADWLEALVERVNATRPDLILFTGDMIDGQPELRSADVRALRDLRANYGVFGSVGNHEYYSGYEFWMSRLGELGMTMLENSHRVIEINGTELAVAGLTDPVARQFGLPGPDCAAALAGVSESAYKIVLDHRPSSFERNAAAGANLQLSGHTHGGHIIGMNRLVARFNSGYVYGWYGKGRASMYVSSGAGLWNGFPVRLGVNSEISRITLRTA